MVEGSNDEARALRAARNQALFRAVNEKLQDLNEAFDDVVGSHAISCECASLDCAEAVRIRREEYEAVREDAKYFVVLRDHVYPEVEEVIREHDGYVVVEKNASPRQREIVAATDPVASDA